MFGSCTDLNRLQRSLSTILAFSAFIFLAAASGTPVVQLNNEVKTTYGLFESCFPGSGGSSTVFCTTASFSCAQLESTRKAAAAFTTMACIIIGLNGLYGVARFFFEKLRNESPYKYLFLGMCAIVVFFSLLGFVLGVSLFDSAFCGSKLKDLNNAVIGPHPPLALVGCLFVVACIVCDYLVLWKGVNICSLFTSSSSSSSISNNNNSHSGGYHQRHHHHTHGDEHGNNIAVDENDHNNNNNNNNNNDIMMTTRNTSAVAATSAALDDGNFSTIANAGPSNLSTMGRTSSGYHGGAGTSSSTSGGGERGHGGGAGGQQYDESLSGGGSVMSSKGT